MTRDRTETIAIMAASLIAIDRPSGDNPHVIFAKAIDAAEAIYDVCVHRLAIPPGNRNPNHYINTQGDSGHWPRRLW